MAPTVNGVSGEIPRELKFQLEREKGGQQLLSC